ncbi:MAG: hypothetical protein IJW14_00660 [Oscillospiraceae bacterium]|nr:hypothetical protein [Oscillospiraceae bacterium]
MRRIVSIFALVVLLAGCGVNNSELDRAMVLRSKLLAASSCSFQAVVTADFSDKTYTFTVACQADAQGNVTFAVEEPQTIAGITGSISAEGGKLTFDDKALAFELLADGQVTPVSAGWLLVRALRGGYVKACGADGDRIRLSIDDSYEENALHLEIWLGEGDLPVYAEILYKDRRFLSMEVKDFRIV